jgi:hypothetical protein
MTALIYGRFAGGFAWMHQPGEFMERSSAAFAHDGRVWLVDPLRAPSIEPEFEALGRVAGVVLTLAWHDRDAAWYAMRYGVPVYLSHRLNHRLLPADVRERTQVVGDRVPESPLELVDAGGHGVLAAWREVAVWWPEHRTLCTGDALGNSSYFVRPGEALAVHPILRLSPPYQLAGLQPERIYCGHGRGVVDASPPPPEPAGTVGTNRPPARAAAALQHALRTARSALVPAWLSSARASVRYVRR